MLASSKLRSLARLLRLLPVLLVAIALGACSGNTGDDGDGNVATGSDSEALTANENTAFDFFHAKKGLTKAQAAGIVGNLIQESNVRATAIQPGGPGRGIAQWSAGGRWNVDARDNVEWYARTRGLSDWSLTLQLEFVWYELESFPSYGLHRLRSATNVVDATVAFQNDFEGCGLCEQSQRIAYARQVLAAH